eukprot:scaffold4840_cov115-Isochrysis_galbana.AAC.24
MRAAGAGGPGNPEGRAGRGAGRLGRVCGRLLMRVHGAHAVAHVLAVTAANEYLEQPLAPVMGGGEWVRRTGEGKGFQAGSDRCILSSRSHPAREKTETRRGIEAGSGSSEGGGAVGGRAGKAVTVGGAPLGNCPSLQHIDESHLVQPGPFKRGGGEGGRARLLCQQRERGALAGRVEGRGGARQWPAGLARAGRRRAGQGGKRPAGGWCGCVGSAVGSLGNLRGGAPACPREDAALNHVVYAEQQRIVHHPAGAQKASVAPRLTQQLPLGARLQPEFPSGRPVRVLANGGVQLGVPIDPGALEVVTLV